MSITLTQAANAHIKSILSKQTDGIGLRIGVKTTGCSGYQYITETATAIGAEDKVIQADDIKIVTDALSLRYLSGCEVDLIKEGLNVQLKFNNPNVDETCGCGQSFSLKTDGVE